jgi:4-hydroxythreonine-4-phosphate dehydrogenase
MIRPVLGITMGDPAGIGPEIAAKALAQPEVRDKARPLVIGDARVMANAARIAHLGQTVRPISRASEATFAPDRIEVLDLQNADPAAFTVGRVSAVCGRAAYEYIERGVQLCQEGAIAGIVTAPVNKEALAAAGVRHSGHTEILAELTGTKAYAMLLMGRELRVIHVTTHVALRRVPDLVTRERVARTIRLGHQAMRDLGMARPRIAVCSNPHAGESGLFGGTRSRSRSRRRSPTPAARVDATGPYPADTPYRAAGGEFCVVRCSTTRAHAGQGARLPLRRDARRPDGLSG